MEKDVCGISRINVKITDAAVRLWQGDAASIQLVGETNNRVFGLTQSGKTFYLRLVSSKNRTKEQGEAELDFIAYLHRDGVCVSLPLPSGTGNLVETDSLLKTATLILVVFMMLVNGLVNYVIFQAKDFWLSSCGWGFVSVYEHCIVYFVNQTRHNCGTFADTVSDLPGLRSLVGLCFVES